MNFSAPSGSPWNAPPASLVRERAGKDDVSDSGGVLGAARICQGPVDSLPPHIAPRGRARRPTRCAKSAGRPSRSPAAIRCLRDGRDYPGGRRDARDAIDDERLERIAHGIDHAGSMLGVLAEEPAERPDLERELERGRAIVAANWLVVRSNADGAEAGRLEDPGEAHAIR